MADDKRDGLVRRMTPTSPRARAAAAVGLPAAGLTAAIYASEPVAHVATGLVHALGVVTAESVGVGAGAAIAITGVMKAGEALVDDEMPRTIVYGATTAVGLAGTAVAIGALAHDIPDAAVIGGIVGVVAGVLSPLLSGIVQEETDTEVIPGLRRIAVGSGAVGVAGIAADMLNGAGLHGVPDPSLMGHIGIGAVAASAVPAAFLAAKHRRDARTQRAANGPSLGE